MFGKASKSDALYLDQKSRNDGYRQTYEYRTIVQFSMEKFDLELNDQAESGWELAGFHVSSGGANSAFYATLRRPRHP